MLDEHHGAFELSELREQPADILRVLSHGRLVQNMEHVFQLVPQDHRQAQTLRFASRQTGR